MSSLSAFASLAIVAALPLAASAKSTQVNSALFASISAPGKGTAWGALHGKRVEARPGAQFVKFFIHLGRSYPIKKISIHSCSQPFGDGVEAFLNFAERRRFIEGGKRSLHIATDDLAGISSFTLNFRHWDRVCLDSVEIFDSRGQITFPQLEEIAPAAATPTEPNQALLALFDSSLSSSWSSDVNNGFQWIELESPVKFTSLLFWNGDQRSGLSFTQNGRAKVVEVMWSDEPAERFELKDTRSPQAIALTKPIETKRLGLKIIESVDGVLKRAAHLSEVRLINDAKHIVVNGTQFATQTAEKNSQLFRSAGLDQVLDRELKHSDREEPWMLRLRSDGSFFMRVFSDSYRESRTHSATGSWTFIEGKKRSITLVLEGTRLSGPTELDSDPCSDQCLPIGPQRMVAEEGVVSDTLVLERLKDGEFMLRNRTPKKNRTLRFSDLKMRLTSLTD